MLIFMELNAFVVALVVLVSATLAVWLRSKNGYLTFFSFIFGIYLLRVVDVVVFPLSIGYDIPDFKPNINLVPFDFGSCDSFSRELCIREIYQNILLTIPFGFGVNFIARIKPKNSLWLALGVGFAFESIQLVISVVFRSPFRAVDINDLILNATGVLLGYGIFRVFGAIYFYVVQKFQSQPRHIFAYVHDIVRQQN